MTRILWIEDYEDLTESLGEILRFKGFSVDILPQDSSLEEAISHSRPDLILLDIKLEGRGEDGFAILERHYHSEDSVIPVVVFSGYIWADYQERAYTLGAKRYLLKPMTVKDLIAEIQAVLRQEQVL